MGWCPSPVEVVVVVVCTGRGDSGDHCCYINGKVCHFWDDGCTLRAELGSWDAVHTDIRWKRAKVGKWFTETYPGYGCGDWPQKIPGLVGLTGSCCWRGE